jgi:hypothetical protein
MRTVKWTEVDYSDTPTCDAAGCNDSAFRGNELRLRGLLEEDGVEITRVVIHKRCKANWLHGNGRGYIEIK